MKNLLNNPSIKKILEKLELNKNPAILIISVFLIVIIYLDFNLFINKQLKTLRNLEPKIVELKKDLSALEKDLLRMQDIKNKQPQADQKIISKAKKIIPDEEKTSVLEDISYLANKHDVKIILIKFSSESQDPKLAKTPTMGKFIPLLINLDLFCDYHQMGAFINDLENGQIFITVQNMKIASQPTDYLKQKVNLVLKTYVRK